MTRVRDLTFRRPFLSIMLAALTALLALILVLYLVYGGRDYSIPGPM
jgi:hypothetical protein